MKSTITAVIQGIIILIVTTCSIALAETTTQSDSWNFMLAPMFLWGKSIEGTQQIGPASSDLDLRFKDDILENLSAALTIHFEARKNDLTLFANYQYSYLDPSVETNYDRAINIDVTDQFFEMGATYRLTTFGINDLHVIAGTRYLRQDIEVHLAPGPGLGLFDIREHWWDGFLGLRIFTHLSENWTFIGRTDLGAGGSELTWNISALIDYRFKDWGSAFLGYRWLDIDYDSGDGLDRFVYDVTQQGPLAGISFYW